MFVGNLPPEAEARDLRDFFRDFGQINDAWVARKPPGFGFVWFDDERDAVFSPPGASMSICRLEWVAETDGPMAVRLEGKADQHVVPSPTLQRRSAPLFRHARLAVSTCHKDAPRSRRSLCCAARTDYSSPPAPLCENRLRQHDAQQQDRCNCQHQRAINIFACFSRRVCFSVPFV